MKNLKKYATAALVATVAIAGAASAQTTPTIDLSGVTPTFAAVVVAGATLGSLWLATKIGIRAYRWLSGAAG